MRKSRLVYAAGLTLVLLIAGAPSIVLGHCDTMDGPTVADGKAALEQGKITPALKWIKADAEPELQRVFDHAIAVRKTGPQAKELADKYFLETLVRLHRQGEGAPYSGLKPSGTKIEPGIEAADKALETGDVNEVIKHLSGTMQQGIRERYEKVRQLQPRKDQSVQVGRQYVEAYVSYVHYVENLLTTAQGAGAQNAEAPQNEEHHQ